jgi:phosphate-selective porin
MEASMSTRKLRKPAAVAASLVLALAISACDSADPDTTDPVDPGGATTTTLVDELTSTTAAG